MPKYFLTKKFFIIKSNTNNYNKFNITKVKFNN